MENATKALLIAGGVLIAILIITVMVMLFNSTGNVSRTYNDRIETEEITKFNTNFTKYLGQKITMHDVVTIYNFAINNKTRKVDCPVEYNATNIQNDLSNITVVNGKRMQNAYEINISYDEDTGYVSQISFNSVGKIEI